MSLKLSPSVSFISLSLPLFSPFLSLSLSFLPLCPFVESTAPPQSTHNAMNEDDHVSISSSPSPEEVSSIDFSPMDFSDNEWLFSHAVVTGRDLAYCVPLFGAHPLLANFTQRVLHGEEWLCIGGHAERLLPKSAAIRFDKAEPLTARSAEDVVKFAQWYSTERPHYPYMPDLTTYQEKLGDTLNKISWVYYEYHSDDASDFMDPKDGTRLDPEVIDIIKADLEVAKAILDELGDKAKLSRYVVEQNYNVLRLRDAHGLAAVVDELKLVRAQALEYIAAISYNLAYVDDPTRRQLQKIYGPYFRSWLIGEAMIGTLIDPNDRLMHTYPLLKLLKDGCPVYLPWDYRYRPTTGIGETVALGNMTGEQFVTNIERAFPLPEPEKGEAPPGSLLSRISAVEETQTPETIERLRRLVRAGDCLFGDAIRPSLFPRWSRGVVWDFKVIRWGYLIVEPAVEARLRHFALTWVLNTDRPAAAILTAALRRGVPFILAFPPEACREFHPNKEKWDVSEPPNYDAIISGPFLSSRIPTRRSWAMYTARATEAMRREEAIGALTVGTLITRLAFEWGPSDLADRLLRGPSARAYPLQKAAYRELGLYADQPTAAIISILLGVVDGADHASKKYWFPPMEVAARFLTPNGVWDRVSEQWFQERLALVRNGTTPNARPLSGAKWVKVLKKRVRRRVASRSRVEPTEEDIQEYRQDLIAESGKDWNVLKLSEVQVTVVRGQGIALNASA